MTRLVHFPSHHLSNKIQRVVVNFLSLSQKTGHTLFNSNNLFPSHSLLFVYSLSNWKKLIDLITLNIWFSHFSHLRLITSSNFFIISLSSPVLFLHIFFVLVLRTEKIRFIFSRLMWNEGKHYWYKKCDIKIDDVHMITHQLWASTSKFGATVTCSLIMITWTTTQNLKIVPCRRLFLFS